MAKVPFNVDAYTARLIGRENVSKLEGAVIELIKNTYDADASVCLLYYDENSDVLYLADNGVGMTEDIISKHWMTIGRSSKKKTYVTSSGRIQTGAKGIGRFALDRIAEQCTMLTGTKQNSTKVMWKVDWSQFKGDRNITEVTADIETVHMAFEEFICESSNQEVQKLIERAWKKNGTIFKLSHLHDKWDETLVKKIRENLSSLIPYELEEIYKIYCFDNTTSIGDAEVFSSVDAFSYDYKIEYEVGNREDRQDVSYKIYRDEFDFGSNEDIILSEAGLLEEKEYFHGKAIEKNCFFKDIVSDQSNSIGYFKGVLYFSKINTSSRDRERFYQKDVSGRIDVRDSFGGLKIYRDSFRVRPYGDPKSSSFDWLQLARRKNASPAGVGTEKGIWRVSADQMLGSIFISRMNISLPDQSNREGIVETKEFQLLKEFTLKMLEELEKDRQYVCRRLNVLYENTHQTETIEKKIREKAEQKKENEKITTDNTSSNERRNLGVDPEEAQKVIDAKDEQIEELQNELKMLRALATTGIVTNTYIHEFKTLTHKLNMKIAMAKEAIDQYHDIEEAGEYINQADSVREAFTSWFQVTIESVKSDKRRRRKVDIAKAISSLSESWNQTLLNKGIHIIFENLNGEEIVLRCFPFEIETIINNLVTNSVASLERISIEKKNIIIKISENEECVCIDYSDTGAGLIEKYKANPGKILQAFETSKRDASGELIGTGMGMWIVNNTVLEYRGKIDLDKNIKTNSGFYATISLRK
ncbi:MAG: sensor histidine kinase [Lachnospiraceae bacterium]|nr:sensor histidine kinase [Lachnospiraceae bacterium]